MIQKNIEKYQYMVFGLSVQSDIMLSELIPAVFYSSPDVEIICGDIQTIDGEYGYDDFYYCLPTSDGLYIDVKNTARYYVTGGDKITIDPYDGSELQSVKLYLLGSCIGAVLLQRGILPIHGSGIVFGDQCFIITGESGAGKSTLSTKFRDLGYSIVTDDVAALYNSEEGVVWVQPSYPQQKLWRDSAEVFGIDVNNHTKVDIGIEKYCMPIIKGFLNRKIQLSAVIEILPSHGSEVYLSKLNGIQKLETLLNHTYRVEYVNGFDIASWHFKQCAIVSSKINFYQLMRPLNGFTVDEQADMIISEINKKMLEV